MSVDRYLSRRYNRKTYNCAHLVCEVWSDLRGPEMAQVLRKFLCGPSERKASHPDLRRIRFLKKPVDPCVVLFQSVAKEAHVGIWLRGRVLHITQSGVKFQPLDVASVGFSKARFFTC